VVKQDTRLKEEYGNVVVNGRKVGEAVMVGTDVAVFVARVIGQQVRIGVASRGGTKVMREETYRQMLEERLAEGPQKFQPLYRIKAKGAVVFYSLEEKKDLSCELIASEEDVTEEDDPLLVVRFATKPEAEAFCLGVSCAEHKCRAVAEEINRAWYAVVQFFDKQWPGGADREHYAMFDRSLPWEEMMKQ